MKCLIVTGGKSPPVQLLHRLKERCSIVISADSGLDTCTKAGIAPDYVLGDFDSLKDMDTLGKIDKDRVEGFSREKDYTDTELALQKAKDLGCEGIVIAGGGGGRLDHLLGIHALFFRKSPPSEWHTHNESCILIEKEYNGMFDIGKRISFFPVSGDETRMKSKGLQWPLDACRWRLGAAGISNRVIEKLVQITIDSGKLLMIFDHSSEDRE